jgi:hypothetical protein
MHLIAVVLTLLIISEPLHAFTYYAWLNTCYWYYSCYYCDWRYYSCSFYSNPQWYDTYAVTSLYYSAFGLEFTRLSKKKSSALRSATKKDIKYLNDGKDGLLVVVMDSKKNVDWYAMENDLEPNEKEYR